MQEPVKFNPLKEDRVHLRNEQEQVARQETGTEQCSGLGSSAVSHVRQEGESDHGEVGVSWVTGATSVGADLSVTSGAYTQSR